jgi:hypothetical protein
LENLDALRDSIIMPVPGHRGKRRSQRWGAVVGALREDLADFIAMSTRGAGGIERTVLGGVATTVVRASEVPTFVVTPAATAP